MFAFKPKPRSMDWIGQNIFSVIWSISNCHQKVIRVLNSDSSFFLWLGIFFGERSQRQPPGGKSETVRVWS